MSATIADNTISDNAGATVGYYEYGDPQGKPVLVFHGTPACGAGFAFAHAAAGERRLRLIAPDRPGIGRSSRRVSWMVGDYPAMVTLFADAMGLDHWARVTSARSPTSPRSSTPSPESLGVRKG
jgi:pimeloyl-ACP methyl ester carboxylesterase